MTRSEQQLFYLLVCLVAAIDQFLSENDVEPDDLLAHALKVTRDVIEERRAMQ
jgi:hypothetical protein